MKTTVWDCIRVGGGSFRKISIAIGGTIGYLIALGIRLLVGENPFIMPEFLFNVAFTVVVLIGIYYFLSYKFGKDILKLEGKYENH